MRNIFQLKVSLKHSNPGIYRILHVADDQTFYELHHIIQIAMGWWNQHLFEFTNENHCISDTSLVDYKPVLDSKSVKLNQFLNVAGDQFQYEYDFGDGWIHTIKLEKILPIQLHKYYPVCIRGKRSCPPEDCGGIGGYYHLLEVMANKKHPDHKEMKNWLGGNFDPDAFSISSINHELKDLENYIQNSMFEL